MTSLAPLTALCLTTCVPFTNVALVAACLTRTFCALPEPELRKMPCLLLWETAAGPAGSFTLYCSSATRVKATESRLLLQRASSFCWNNYVCRVAEKLKLHDVWDELEIRPYSMQWKKHRGTTAVKATLKELQHLDILTERCERSIFHTRCLSKRFIEHC